MAGGEAEAKEPGVCVDSHWEEGVGLDIRSTLILNIQGQMTGQYGQK